jgi:futalosine hydrolase
VPQASECPCLIIAATKAELEPLLARLEAPRELPLPLGAALRGSYKEAPLVVAWLGVGKVNTAAGLALAIGQLRPATVVQLGVGGAFAGSGLRLGSAVVASEEHHLDLGAFSDSGFEDLRALGFPLLAGPRPVYNRLPLDLALANGLAAGRWPLRPFGTAETVTGVPAEAERLRRRFRVDVESMEGAAAAQVCLALGVPFAEVRGVSNAVGERDKARWRLGAAILAATEVVEEWLAPGAPGRSGG